MTPFRPSRERRAPDRYLHVKMLIFVIGAGFLLAGIASERDWLVTVAVLTFAAGLLIRLFDERRQRIREDEILLDEDGPFEDESESDATAAAEDPADPLTGDPPDPP
jgi:hypothetical protein